MFLVASNRVLSGDELDQIWSRAEEMFPELTRS